MDNRAISQLSDSFAGAIDWWRDAGVDHLFEDEPIRWIVEEPPESGQPAPPEQEPRKPRPKAAEPTPAARPAIDPAHIPASLSAFQDWWLSEPILAAGPASQRLPPRGLPSPDLMIVVPEPEREDRDHLLSGAQGRLLDAMLLAMNVSRESVYFASALPRHMPGADWDELAASGLGRVLAAHIALVRPKRLAIFGANILSLLENGPPQGPADLRIFDHEGGSTPLLACRSLAALLEQPRWKARVWQAWLDWAG